VCVLKGPANGDAQAEIRKYETTNACFERLCEWLVECGCTHVVMESTGEYWRPIYNVLEEATDIEIMLANSQQVKGCVATRRTHRMRIGWRICCATT
jgi:transposase